MGRLEVGICYVKTPMIERQSMIAVELRIQCTHSFLAPEKQIQK